jgi:hypothetical protein
MAEGQVSDKPSDQLDELMRDEGFALMKLRKTNHYTPDVEMLQRALGRLLDQMAREGWQPIDPDGK